MSALSLAALGASATSTAQEKSNGLTIFPAHNWILPLFTPEGYHSVTLKGDEATVRRDGHLDVTDCNITLFSGTASNQITTIILSPAASYFPKLQLATGPSSVRIIRALDNAEAAGEDWTYDFAHERVSLRRHVRVTFQQPLNDFLK